MLRPVIVGLLLLVPLPAGAQTDAEISTLRRNLTHADPKMRLQAVRDVGRLERADLIAALTRPLADDHVTVRIEAANAVGQLARGEKGVADAKARLLQRARVEKDPRAWGAVAATLGRLAYTSAQDVEQVEVALARVLPTASSTTIQIDALLGATEGFEALARQSGKIARLKGTTLTGLRAAAVLQGRAQDSEKLTRIRRLATLALTAAGGATRPSLEAGVADADPEVRRLTMVAARGDVDGREQVVRRGLADPHPQVRYEALQTWGRLFQQTSCEPTLQATTDSNAHVALLAIDQLGNGCAEVSRASDTLRSFATGLAGGRSEWHRPAHAVVALAKVAAGDARQLMPQFVQHEVWQVRMYAARAAGVLADLEQLTRLARDPHHNVREAALAELTAARSPAAVSLAIEALTSADYQLVMTAARAVSTASDVAPAIEALQRAHARISAERRDTSRDALEAIRDAVTRLGGPPLPPFTAGPLAGPLVTADQITALANMRLRFTMAGRGTFVLRLLPDEAPITSQHITNLARQGYYNGLTFHRVVPNFVIQGGSPGANEYAGQGPFMRDEVGLPSHRRGTVGISTRGRHTGDAQIFVNLVDLPRLDHTYTVFAEVVSGMEVVDQILEGDVIERVDVMTPDSNDESDQHMCVTTTSG
jgi:cyclophilin family peptidyl-prolyl cis-trans isomerase/HEAT repeat protein